MTMFCDITLPPSFTSCTGNSMPQKLSTPAYPTPNRLPQFEYSASCMSIAKTVPSWPISDFLRNIILPSCPKGCQLQLTLPKIDSPNLNIVHPGWQSQKPCLHNQFLIFCPISSSPHTQVILCPPGH